MTLAALIVSGSAARAQQANGLGIAAVVNDDVISALDLHTRATMVITSSGIENTPDNRARITPQVLRSLIDEKLMLQEARRADIKVTQNDINDGLARLAASNNASVEELSQGLARMGVPLSALSARVEAELAWQAFVFRTLRRKIKISEDEITDEINLLQANAGKPEYQLAEIFLPVDTPSQDDEVRLLAMRLLQQMRQGASFKSLASNFSRATSAATGGDLGWVQFAHLDEALQRVLPNLQPGQVSVPVRAIGGYYLVLLRDVRTSPGLGSAESIMKLTQLHMTPAPPDNSDALRDLSNKMTEMTRAVTNCAQLDALGAQVGSNLSGSMGEISLSALPDDMRKVLAPLAVGQPSTPVPTGGGLAVLMICERLDEALNMEKVRDAIAKRLQIERLDVAANRHLRDLRRNAFVDIR